MLLALIFRYLITNIWYRSPFNIKLHVKLIVNPPQLLMTWLSYCLIMRRWTNIYRLVIISWCWYWIGFVGSRCHHLSLSSSKLFSVFVTPCWACKFCTMLCFHEPHCCISDFAPTCHRLPPYLCWMCASVYLFIILLALFPVCFSMHPFSYCLMCYLIVCSCSVISCLVSFPHPWLSSYVFNSLVRDSLNIPTPSLCSLSDPCRMLFSRAHHVEMYSCFVVCSSLPCSVPLALFCLFFDILD